MAGTAGRAALTRGARLFAAKPEMLPAFLLLAVIVGFTAMNSSFLSAVNISGMLAYIPEVGLIALGMTMLLTAGQFDLSVGAVFGFTPLVIFIMVNNEHVPLPAAAVVGLLIAAFIGLVNGVVVTRFGISSFLVTLSTQLIIAGAGLYISNGFPQATLSVSSWLVRALIGSAFIGGVRVYASLGWFLLVAGVLWYVLTQSRLGNWIMATGGNRETAQARGIKTGSIAVGLFILTSVTAGLAGTISDLRVGSAYPTAGTGYELEAIAMAVVGGTSLFGGSGTIIGTVLGAFLLEAIQNGVILAGVPGLAYEMFVGAIILIVMILQVGLRRLPLTGMSKSP